ncbi:MAG: hypothetical protein QOG54_1743 [Actinomycetota bacterium]|jgi:hypothetical protein|nr:hypothetical protein [Actinomycetota bacterium]
MHGSVPVATVFAHVLTKSVREISPFKLAFCVVAVIAGIVALVLWSPVAARDEKQARSAYAKRVAHRRWLIRSVAGAVLLLAGLGAVPLFAFETTTRSVAHVEKEIEATTEGSELPVDVIGSTASGSVEISVSNPDAFAVHSQCVIKALDQAGASVVKGSYVQFGRDGRASDSEDYTSRVVVPPKDVHNFEVDLNITADVARYEIACESIPFTQELIDKLEEEGIPFERFPSGGGAGTGP